MFPAKILLATDGSEEASRAARMAAALAEKTGSELHVAYVEPLPDHYALPEAVTYGPDLRSEVRERADREAIEKLAVEVERLKEMGDVAGSHARIGRPDKEISHLAEEIGAGLIVVGSKGHGLVRRTLMGSVSNSVVRHAHGPVLVVREGGESLPDKVLLAVDGSGEARLAVQAAAELSASTGAEVHVAHVMPTAERLFGPHLYSEEAKSSMLDQVEGEARGLLDRQAEGVEAAGGRLGGRHLVSGKAEAEIVSLAEEIGAGLTIVGSRGLDGVRRALMGSVSDSVVHHAHNPVLVVREN